MKIIQSHLILRGFVLCVIGACMAKLFCLDPPHVPEKNHTKIRFLLDSVAGRLYNSGGWEEWDSK